MNIISKIENINFKEKVIKWGKNSKYFIIEDCLDTYNYEKLLSNLPTINYKPSKTGTGGKPKNKVSIELNNKNKDYQELNIEFKSFIENNFNFNFLFKLLKIFEMEDIIKDKTIGFSSEDNTDFLFLCNFSCNPIIGEKVSPIRRIHLDEMNQLITGLYYIRYEDDKSEGGDLELFNYRDTSFRDVIKKKESKGMNLGRNYFNSIMQDRKINAKSSFDGLEKTKIKKFNGNSCIFWKNSIDAIHSVTDRFDAKYPRQYISFGFYKNKKT